jgi:pantoate--beta-alanine ligase
MKEDLALCRKEGVDVVFAPPQHEVYPPDFQTQIIVTQLSKRWEGESRPTHFQGVATIVSKLLILVYPTKAFFGQKDYQQTLLVQQLTKDLCLPITIAMCPTVRETQGLAWSSRNQLLTAPQRVQAVTLYQALQAGKTAIDSGIHDIRKIRQTMLKIIYASKSVQMDYLSICDPVTLEPLRHLQSKMVLLGAIRVGGVRLIDNLMVRSSKQRVKNH